MKEGLFVGFEDGEEGFLWDFDLAHLLHAFLADGSCRSITPSISVASWNNALQPNDGSPPGSDW